MLTKQSRKAGGARWALRLEAFEDRLAPATFYVNTTLDDSGRQKAGVEETGLTWIFRAVIDGRICCLWPARRA